MCEETITDHLKKSINSKSKLFNILSEDENLKSGRNKPPAGNRPLGENPFIINIIQSFQINFLLILIDLGSIVLISVLS